MRNFESIIHRLVTGLRRTLSAAFSDNHMEMANQEAQRLCKQLSFLGVNAKTSCTACVEITDSPVRWINVMWGYDSASDAAVYTYEYDVPDWRLLPKIAIHAVPVRSGWRHTKDLIDIHWKGNDRGTGISHDQEIKVAIMSLINENPRRNRYDTWGSFLSIFTSPEPSLWVIRRKTAQMDYVFPRQEQWKDYESIAKRLLAIAIPK
jgi:hypothetical protein